MDGELAALANGPQQSHLAPINYLPVELLCAIFRRFRGDLATIWNVSHTCKLWRDVSVGDPQLWSHLDLGRITWESLHLHVLRSLQHPLHVVCHVQTTRMKEASRIVQMLAQEDISVPETADPDPVSWITMTRHLKVMHLELPDIPDFWDPLPNWMVEFQAPELESLTLARGG